MRSRSAFLHLTTIWRQKLCLRYIKPRILVPQSLSLQLTYKTKDPRGEKQSRKMGAISATIYWWGRVSFWENVSHYILPQLLCGGTEVMSQEVGLQWWWCLQLCQKELTLFGAERGEFYTSGHCQKQWTSWHSTIRKASVALWYKQQQAKWQSNQKPSREK